MNIPQMCPFIGIDEYESIKECFESTWVTEGPKSKQFVKELCNIIGVKHAVLAPNGTLALYLGLKAMGIGEGDEVIVPNFTFIASATSILMAGATPVFVDIDLESLQIDVDKCKDALTGNTKAIMPVHIYGASCDMTSVISFADSHNIKVIEDAAQAMGVFWKEKHCGSFGDVGCFSFFADKTITTIEGGLVCTDDDKIYENLLYMRNQGRLNRGTFIHPRVGFNFRMNDVQASIGIVQLLKKEEIYKRKIHLYNRYCENLKNLDFISIVKPLNDSNLIPFRVCIMCKDKKDNLVKFLKNKGIESRTFFYPLNKQPCFSYLNEKQDLSDINFTNSINAFNRGVCLPVYPSLTDAEVDYICSCILEFYDGI